MSDKEQGSGKGFCDVCSRSYTWGCGHNRTQEKDARRHRGTKKHAERACTCYGHDKCNPKKCKLAGIQIRGYMPFYQHDAK